MPSPWGAAAKAGSDHGLLDVPEWPDAEKLKFEKEALDFYISSHPLAQHAQTHDAHRVLGPYPGFAVAPPALGHVSRIAVEFAEVAHDGMADKLGHLHRHAGVVQPDDARARRQAQLEQRVHAGAGVEDAAQRRLLVQKLLRRRPDHGVFGLRRARRPFGDVHARQRGPKTRQPGFGLGVAATEGDAQGHGVSPA